MSAAKNDHAAQVKAATDILAVIGSHVQLQRKGELWEGLCPFHKDSDPSFKVYAGPTDPHYHCYGCGAHGDVFDFLMRAQNRTFKDVLDDLAAATRVVPGSMPYRHAGSVD